MVFSNLVLYEGDVTRKMKVGRQGFEVETVYFLFLPLSFFCWLSPGVLLLT